MDIVYIRDLRIDTIIGIYDWEREVRQTVSIDLEMASDIRKAAETDDIQHALNYKAVSKRFHGTKINLAQGGRLHLLDLIVVHHG